MSKYYNDLPLTREMPGHYPGDIIRDPRGEPLAIVAPPMRSPLRPIEGSIVRTVMGRPIGMIGPLGSLQRLP